MQINMSLWWCFVLFSAMVLGLAACDSPSMAFKDIPTKRIVVAGSEFSVRHTAYEAEAIRVNVEWPPRRRDIVVKGVAAIEVVSGCPVDVRSVRGDTNIVLADLNCPGEPERQRPYRPAKLFCTSYDVSGLGEGYTEIECEITR